MGLKLQQLDLSPIELKTVGKAYSSLGRLISIVDEREQFINQFTDLEAMEKEENSKYYNVVFVVHRSFLCLNDHS